MAVQNRNSSLQPRFQQQPPPPGRRLNNNIRNNNNNNNNNIGRTLTPNEIRLMAMQNMKNYNNNHNNNNNTGIVPRPSFNNSSNFNNKSAQAAQVRVTGLTPNITKLQLMNHFQRFGHVINIHLPGNGYGIIQYTSRLNVQACLGKGLRHKISGTIVSLSMVSTSNVNKSSSSPRNNNLSPIHTNTNNLNKTLGSPTARTISMNNATTNNNNINMNAGRNNREQFQRSISQSNQSIYTNTNKVLGSPTAMNNNNNNNKNNNNMNVIRNNREQFNRNISKSNQDNNKVDINNLMREKKKKRDPRLEDEHDDKIISNISKKKRKLVHAPIRHNDRNRQIAMMKKRYQSKIIAGHHIDDCVRDAMSLSTRYNGLVVPEEFIEMESNWVYTFPVNIAENVGLKSNKKNSSTDDKSNTMMMMMMDTPAAPPPPTTTTTTTTNNTTIADKKTNTEQDANNGNNYLKSNLMEKHPFIVCEWLHQGDYKVGKNRKTKVKSAADKLKDHISIDPATENRVVYNAHVLLHTMGTERMKVEKVLPKDQLEMPCFQILMAKLSNGIYSLPGGKWSKSQDKGDPCIDDRNLIETCIRCTKYQSGIDLTLCTEWVKVSQFNYRTYDKDGVLEVRTVILLPNVTDLIPSMDIWNKIRGYILKDAGGKYSLNEKKSKCKGMGG